MKLSFRWYGQEDTIKLGYIRQIPNMYSIVTAIYDVPVGETGSNGHIAIKTNNIDRAMNHLAMKGHPFDETTAKYDQKGKLKAIYLQKEIKGFAVHLVQKAK